MNIFLFLFFLFSLTFISSQQSFQTFKYEMQQKVKSIANAIQSVYATKCSNQLIRNCSVGSIDSCKGTNTRQCITSLPSSKQCKGIGFYSKKSVIKMPSWITQLNMSQQTKQFICSTAQQQVQSTLSKIQNQNNQRYYWAYFGSNDGSFRFVPGFRYPQTSPGICRDYDPRLRPWYVQNAYNRKNVIILAETSSTMSLNGGNRLNGMILSLNALIQTLDSDDFLNIVEFNQDSRSILNLNYMIPVSGNIGQRTIFFNAVNNLTASRNSNINYQGALLTALNIINQSINGNQSRNDCKQNLILLFSDGNPNYGQTNASNLKIMIDKYVKNISVNLPLTIFTFNLNKDPINLANSIMPQLSCFYGGMHFNIPQIVYKSQFMTAAQGYFQFLSYGNQMIQQQAWSKIYMGALGLGLMTTVVYPAYFINGQTRILLGVAGIDVLVSQFQKYEPNESQIQKRLSSDGLCFVKKIGNCYLQHIRETKCKNINCNSSQFLNISNSNSAYRCANKISDSSKVIIDPIDTSFKDCCIKQQSDSNSILIGTLISGFALLILLIAGFCYYRYLKSNKLCYDDLKKFKDFDDTRIRTQQQISPIHD